MEQLKITSAAKDKTDREKEVLFGLLEIYAESGKPVGSQTLKEGGFDHLSPATIRNYCSKLEEEGYLLQPHTSGGRIPTEKAYRLYAQTYLNHGIVSENLLGQIESMRHWETREVQVLARKAVEELSRITGTAAFIISPRFDHDFVSDIKILPIDNERLLAVLITDFGAVQPEIIMSETKISTHAAKRIETCLNARLLGRKMTEHIENEEEEFAKKLYNEVMVRFLVGYTNFSEAEVLTAGLGNMLHYQEFREPALLAESLAVFESNKTLRHLLRNSMAHGDLRCWIGKELTAFGTRTDQIAIAAMPYSIHHQTVGALGVLGPCRMPYRHYFGILRAVSQAFSETLTKNLYKFKLTFRQPENSDIRLSKQQLGQLPETQVKLIEERNDNGSKSTVG